MNYFIHIYIGFLKFFTDSTSFSVAEASSRLRVEHVIKPVLADRVSSSRQVLLKMFEF